MNIFNYLGNIVYDVKNFFYKKNSFVYGSSYLLGQKGAIWVNVDKPNELYNTIPQVKAVVDKKALMFSNMDIKLIDSSTGEKVDDPEFYKLMANPNILQAMNDWLRQYKTQEQVYGNQFMYKNKPSNLIKYPLSLMNISPRYMTPYLTGKVFNQVKIEDVIAFYEYYEDGDKTKKRFETTDILFSRINDIDNPIIGVSPLSNLIYPISNIKAAYEYRNVIMTEKGAIGILSNESKDAMGAIPLPPSEKKAIQDSYINNFGAGVGQQRIHITEASLKWQPMTYPTKDLMLFEEVDANTLTIIDSFGLNVNMFSNKNATYENVKNSIIQVYQDTIIPEADQFTQALGNFIGIEKGKEMLADFSHISILQDDENDKTDSLSKKIAAITQLSDKGIISNSTALEVINNLTGLNIISSNNNSLA